MKKETYVFEELALIDSDDIVVLVKVTDFTEHRAGDGFGLDPLNVKWARDLLVVSRDAVVRIAGVFLVLYVQHFLSRDCEALHSSDQLCALACEHWADDQLNVAGLRMLGSELELVHNLITPPFLNQKLNYPLYLFL